ncbi:MAG: valine--tRNA ligase [Candidatus Levybacteria bacterium RIFCSPLOWO2_01_FULL_39_10]|nr:MAG: valine--tRNA ligase [Candidatus Levybacteria bacterium RIFCSPLOWO2_01_FULL_39_10]
MNKIYNHKEVEEKIYKKWEDSGSFKPEVNPNGQPYSIILPPPNANAPLHFGHAMYVVEDILVRFRRMMGHATLWLPGTDHAGFETQFVFERELQREGKSRFDYDREKLYQMIWDFVESNRGEMEKQLKSLGFSLDWDRMRFTLDPEIIKIVYKTFKKLYDDELIYRDLKLINFCTHDGTSFSDLEVKHIEQKDPLYYMRYGPFSLATVRPETKFGDTAVAVHPDDKRYKKYIGKEIEFESLIGRVKLKVIGDSAVDPEFGTGVVKVTPSHDFNDFEMGKRHNLPMRQVIGFDGRLTSLTGKYKGLKVAEARRIVSEDLKKEGLLEKIDERYTHTVATCYKCGRVLEPLPLEQWFVKVKPLADAALNAIKKGEIKFIPKRFEKTASTWLENFHDWNISRQLVWGIRIPAWKCKDCSKWTVTEGMVPEQCPNCKSKELVQDTDTFDTWFSSGQWPYATLLSQSRISNFQLPISNEDINISQDFKKFYPTSVMETGYDILPWWVVRMIMLGIYETGKVPFKTVYLHGLVRDQKGKKMSKSRGNVINPIDMAEKYSADAVRMALIFGASAGNDLSLSEDKIRGMRNFTNKIWNIARFIDLKRETRNPKLEIRNNLTIEQLSNLATTQTDKEMIKLVEELVKRTTKHIEKFELNLAAEGLYEFMWHEFADKYIENVKGRLDKDSYIIVNTLYLILLRLLHPFMPFITEEIFGKFSGNNSLLITEKWPKAE